jgi:hypothetical protein
MSTSKATGLAAVGFATVLALIVAGCAYSEADTRKGIMKRAGVVVQPQEKPHQLRYYGGPKSPMS